MSDTGYVPLRTQTLACCGTGRGDINIFQDNVRNAETSIEHHVCREGAAGWRKGGSIGRRGRGNYFLNNNPNGIPTGVVFH